MKRRLGFGCGMLAAVCLSVADWPVVHAQQPPVQRKRLKPQAPQLLPELLIAPFDEQQARAARAGWARHQQIDPVRKNSLGMELVLIPAGRFSMGRRETTDQVLDAFPYATKGWIDGEKPYHVVTISQPFYLGKYEVTLGQFRKFVNATGYTTDAERGEGGVGYIGNRNGPFERRRSFSWRGWGVDQTNDSPVVNVSYNDAVEFCNWLSKQERKPYRLPTEAEWEYACRAGTATRYYNGDDFEELTRIGNVWDATGKEKVPPRINRTNTVSVDGWPFTSPVGKFKPNNFGLYDMIGNAREWCADRYDKEYYAKSPSTDPHGPLDGTERVIRGGSWNEAPINDRAACRDSAGPTYCEDDVGFRIVCSP